MSTFKTSSAQDQVVTTKELMQLLKVKHRQTIYKLIENGMPVIQSHRNYQFMQSKVIQFLKNQSQSHTMAQSVKSYQK